MTAGKTHAEMKKGWPTLLREDGVRVEIICPHGVGHPSQVLSGKGWVDSWMGVHGCDGCCSQAAFALAEMSHCKERGIAWPPPRQLEEGKADEGKAST